MHWSSAPPDWFKEVVGDKINFIGAVRTLLAYSFIEAKEGFNAFTMHPVVHEWCRSIMNADKRQSAAYLAITTVGFAVPGKREKEYWTVQPRLLPHVGQCLQQLQSLKDDTLSEEESYDLNRAIIGLGFLYREQQKFAEAEAIYRRVLDSSGRHFKPELDCESVVALRACSNLGCLYIRQGKLTKAETMLQII